MNDRESDSMHLINTNMTNLSISDSRSARPKDKRQHHKRRYHKPKNTEDFSPSHKPADMRILFAKPSLRRFDRTLNPRDVVFAPELFCSVGNKVPYEALLEELKASGSDDLFVSWHGDTHHIANDRNQNGRWKENSPAFRRIVSKIESYFGIRIEATRLNWYKTSAEWKPFHHDAAALKPRFAKKQNFTIAASFGHEREAAFQHVRSRATVSMPLPNGSAYAFSRDVNIEWKHGIPQVDPESQTDEGRISIIAWGWVELEEFAEA